MNYEYFPVKVRLLCEQIVDESGIRVYHKVQEVHKVMM